MVTRALLLLLVMIATAHADIGPPPPVPRPPPQAPTNVPPTLLEGLRVAGTKEILPDAVTRTEMARAGKDRYISSFKLCLAADGSVAAVTQLKSSGYRAYDDKVVQTIRGEWRYKPYTLAGKAVPVCTAVTFIYAPAPSEPGLTVLKPGKAPTRELHFAVQKGSKRTLVITAQDTRARGVHGKLGPAEPQPGSRFELDCEVVEVAPNGDAGVDLTYKKVEVVPVKADAATKAANAELAKLAGTTAHVVITQSGLAKHFELGATPNVAAPVRQLLESNGDLLHQLADELPDAPLGIGAVWETVRTVSAGEMTVELKTTRELVAIDGTKITLRVTLTADGHGSGAGNLTSRGTGNGEVVIDLASPLPAKARLEMQTDTELDSGGTRLAQHNVSTTTLTAR